MKLSRQFRDKTEESFDFEITTTSSPQTVEFALGSGGRMGFSNFHRIYWGDGSDPEPINSSSYISHDYAVAGSYTIKVWTREKNHNITQYAGNKLGVGISITNLDFSNMKQLYKFLFPVAASVSSISMPTEYEGSSGVQWSNVGGTYTFTSNILDFSIYNSRIDSIFMGGSMNIDRIKTPATNLDTNCQFYFSVSSGIKAIGPSADNLSNFDADFTNYNLYGQFRLKGTGANPTNWIMPASSFSSSGISNTFYVDKIGCSTLDLTHLKMSTPSGKALYLIDNDFLTSITWPTAVTGTFNTLNLRNNPLANIALDLSWTDIDNGTSIYGSDSGFTSVKLPASTATIKYLYIYNSDIVSINLTALPNATEQNDFWIRAADNNMTAAEVNQILVDLDTNSTGAYTGRIIDISGTNAAPDATSGSNDGLTAKSNLITKNFTVSTS